MSDSKKSDQPGPTPVGAPEAVETPGAGYEQGAETDVPKPTLHELERRNAEQHERILELQSLVSKLTQETLSLRQKITSVRLQYKEASEEFERAKIRIQREAKMEIDQQKARLVRPSLSTMDDLERAIAAAEISNEESPILNGIRIVRSNLLHTLAEIGVRPMETLGQQFDAASADAVGTAETDDPERVGKVVEVVEKGYLMKDEVLRPAKVIVGQARMIREEPESGAVGM